jgi:hypothetical protein
LGIETYVSTGREGFLYAAIFAGMEGEDGDATARIQTGRELAQQGIEGEEFVVHGNTEGLEDTADT